MRDTGFLNVQHVTFKTKDLDGYYEVRPLRLEGDDPIALLDSQFVVCASPDGPPPPPPKSTMVSRM